MLRLEDEESVCGQTEKDERGEAVDLSRFQVSNAACSKRWDREQILASIEAAFGDVRVSLSRMDADVVLDRNTMAGPVKAPPEPWQ